MVVRYLLVILAKFDNARNILLRKSFGALPAGASSSAALPRREKNEEKAPYLITQIE